MTTKILLALWSTIWLIKIHAKQPAVWGSGSTNAAPLSGGPLAKPVAAPAPAAAAAPAAAPAGPSKSESDDKLIARLITDGIEGKMDEINALDNKVLRGKIKSGIVKAKKNLK